MKIRYLGHSCFEITTDKGIKIITDPYAKVGYELPKGLAADIVTVSHGHFDHCFTAGVAYNRLMNTADCFEERGVEICGISSYHDEVAGAKRGKNILFKIKADGLTLCHMGDIGEKVAPALIEKIGEVDILMLPVGGTYTVDSLGAKKYVDEISPRAVLPMHYRPADGSLDIAEIQPFLSLFDSVCEVKDGVLEVDKNTRGVFYMHRIK